MTGIYIIKNTINNKVYIGQAVNILHRWYQHRYVGGKTCSSKHLEYKNKIHTAMRELGKENFYIEILEECKKEDLSRRERYWIEKYDSFYSGYNGTKGGSWKDVTHIGEENGRAKLSEQDVRYIRECYNNHVSFRKVYEIFQDKISKRGLQKVWYFETWPLIYPEYNTKENKKWHSTKSKSIPAHNRKFSENEIKMIRQLHKQGLSCPQIISQLKLDASKDCIEKIVNYTYYKDIV